MVLHRPLPANQIPTGKKTLTVEDPDRVRVLELHALTQSKVHTIMIENFLTS